MNETQWETTKNLPSQAYTCGFCNKKVASQTGYEGETRCDAEEIVGEPGFFPYKLYIYICPHCGSPTLIDTEIAEYTESFIESQFPKPETNHSKVIEGLTGEVENAYDEVNKCVAAGTWTATAMLCRKILMNIAVSRGGKENENFTYYVNYLDKNGHLTKELKEWVDEVRSVGNDANHKIEKISKSQAMNIFEFIQLLLIIIYELPYKRKKASPQPVAIKPNRPQK